jgi:hypothetical protein
MIDAKLKARQLVESMALHHWVDGICRYEEAKECALIMVNELIKQTGSKYWYDVKHEIEKL